MGLHRPDYERDVIYLFQFARGKFNPNMSPFCLKLETWLRMADLKYQKKFKSGKLQNEDSGIRFSNRGQVPFIELNGQQISDSSMIIKDLTEIFQTTQLNPQTEEEIWQTVMVDRLLEGSIFWTYEYHRSRNVRDRLYAGMNLPNPIRMIKPIAAWYVGRKLETKVFEQGYGHYTEKEVRAITNDDLMALSMFLGNKKYMMGDRVTTVDACAFGHLCQWWFIPDEPAARSFLGQNCPNLVTYLQRIKTDYWPDWNDVLATGSMSSQWKPGTLNTETSSEIRDAGL